MSAPQTPDVPALLAALGDTPDAVAATLRAGGFRMMPADWSRRHGAYISCRCPVAVYLTASLAAPYGDVTVSGSGCSVKNGRGDWNTYEVPTPVQLFVNAFDFGDYRDLGEVPA